MIDPVGYYEFTYAEYLTGEYDLAKYKAVMLFVYIFSGIAILVCMPYIFPLIESSKSPELAKFCYCLSSAVALTCFVVINSNAILIGTQIYLTGLNRTDSIVSEMVACDDILCKKMTVTNVVYSIPEFNVMAVYNYSALFPAYKPTNTTTYIKYLDWSFDYSNWSENYVNLQCAMLVWIILSWVIPALIIIKREF